MKNNNELSKGTKIKVAIITVLVILTTLAGITFAFFSIGVTGNEEASSVTVTAALLRLTYSDNLSLGGSSIYPGWSQSKTITVENTGTDTVYYKIIWRELLNEITNNELTLSATCSASSGACPTISEQVVGTHTTAVNDVTIKNGIEIAPNVTHTYTVTVTFKEMSSAQNYNQGKSFYGTLNIAEGSRVSITRTANTYEGMDIVTIGPEEFYDITGVIDYSSLISATGNIYNYDSTKTILLAKYNLYAGRIYDSTKKYEQPWTKIESTDTGYGYQNINAKGSAASPAIGVVPFSGTNYWHDSVNSAIYSKYGTYGVDYNSSYSANNIYDSEYVTAPNFDDCMSGGSNSDNCSSTGENYSIAYYVESYIDRLGVEATGRLLTYPEANAMTQVQRTNGQEYWLGSAVRSSVVKIVNYDGSTYEANIIYASYLGVRPVLVVNSLDIQ